MDFPIITYPRLNIANFSFQLVLAHLLSKTQIAIWFSKLDENTVSINTAYVAMQ